MTLGLKTGNKGRKNFPFSTKQKTAFFFLNNITTESPSTLSF